MRHHPPRFQGQILSLFRLPLRIVKRTVHTSHTRLFSRLNAVSQVFWIGLVLGGVGIVSAQEPAGEQTTVRSLLETFRKEFVPITPGQEPFPKQFLFGSGAGTAQVSVELQQPFEIAKYEIYQNLYTAVMGENPSRWKGPRNSAERMTHAEALQFCEKVTRLLREAKLIDANQSVRLPTEVEWEYCARAGTTTDYSFGNEAQQPGDQGNKASLLDPYAWHTGNAAGNDPAVGVLKPNPWGLYDIHGYLWEFCLDHWAEDLATVTAQPHAPVQNESGLVSIRGGSWKDRFPLLTSAARLGYPPQRRDDAVGFRCVLITDSAPKP